MKVHCVGINHDFDLTFDPNTRIFLPCLPQRIFRRYSIFHQRVSDVTSYIRHRSFSPRFPEHRRPSTTASEVYNHYHIESPGHFVDLDNIRILDRDSRWFERGVKEAVHIKANKPLPNKDGAGTNSLESTRKLSGQGSKRSIPDIASYITHSLMKDGVPSENSEVGINFCVWIKS